MIDYIRKLKEKLENYRAIDKARGWLDKNIARVQALFSNYTLRDFIFDPFKAVFTLPEKTVDAHIYSVITQVAVINMVLAGLPGKMGVGIWVSVAFEGWMAYSIARHIGIHVEKPSDIWKYFGMLAASIGIILYAFRVFLGIAFSAISVVSPIVNPLIIAELLVTDFVGVLFWVGFNEVHADKPFRIPARLTKTIFSRCKGIFDHQYRVIKETASPSNIMTVAKRITAYLKGDFPIDMQIINGEIFATAAMAYLINDQYEKLEGPVGETFLQAIRLRWSDQFDHDTSVSEIADRFREYDTESLTGAINTIKGKMFEIMVTDQENLDSDQWSAQMHTDESFPGSDIVFTNEETGDQIEVSLKAISAENTQIIERALARYPDMPIMTTDEAAELYGHEDMVFGSGITNEELQDLTEEKLDELINRIEVVNEQQVVIGGVTVGSVAALWPFVMAFLRGRITQDQLERVFKHVLGETGVKLASRVVYGAVFGALFAWYLLARGINGLVVMAEPNKKTHIEFVPKQVQHA
jgi:hypothetical protein